MLFVQEDLSQPSLSGASSASMVSQHVPEQELLPDQASFASRAGSTLSTPRSLRPGTVPRLDLSPAIALHMASLDGAEEEEEAPAHHRQEEERDTQRQAAAMASFDDLSGPDASDVASEAASVAPSVTASLATVDVLADADVADHASTTSSAASSMLGPFHMHSIAASTELQTLFMPSASPHFLGSEGPRAPSDETSQTSSAAHRAETALALEANVVASNISQASVTATAHAQATAVGTVSSMHVTDLPDDAALSAPTAELGHRLPAVKSDQSLSTASSVSEELEEEADDSSQEASPRSDHLSVSQGAEATAAAGRPSYQAQAGSETVLEADDVQLSFEAPVANHPLTVADLPLLQPQSVVTSLLPLLARNIGKKDSEDREQQHLAPDLLAYAEAAMTEVAAEGADRPFADSNTAARQAEVVDTVPFSNPVSEAASHGQQADEIAAELFDNLLSDAVHSMITPGASALHMHHPASQFIVFTPSSEPSSPAPPPRLQVATSPTNPTSLSLGQTCCCA